MTAIQIASTTMKKIPRSTHIRSSKDQDLAQIGVAYPSKPKKTRRFRTRFRSGRRIHKEPALPVVRCNFTSKFCINRAAHLRNEAAISPPIGQKLGGLFFCRFDLRYLRLRLLASLDRRTLAPLATIFGSECRHFPIPAPASASFDDHPNSVIHALDAWCPSGVRLPTP